MPNSVARQAGLKAAGAVILGKTKCRRAWATGRRQPHLRPHQPSARPGRTPGGSSGGGAAALAAGMVPLEVRSGYRRLHPRAFVLLRRLRPQARSWGVLPSAAHRRRSSRAGAEGAWASSAPWRGPPADLALALRASPVPPGRKRGARLTLPPPRRAGPRRTTGSSSSTEHPGWARGAGRDRPGPRPPGPGSCGTAGVRVERKNELLPDLARRTRVYMTILSSIMFARGARHSRRPISAHAWMGPLKARGAIRRRWAALFETYDVVIAPTFGVVGLPARREDRSRSAGASGTGRDYRLHGPDRLARDGDPGQPSGHRRPHRGDPGGSPRRRPDHRTLPQDLTPIAVAGLLERALM